MSYTAPQLERLWTQAGGPQALAPTMAAVALAESSGQPAARNPSGASGLWQILGVPFPGNVYDPLTNARMAVAKYRSQGLGAWTTYTDGTYRQYLPTGTPSPPAAASPSTPSPGGGGRTFTANLLTYGLKATFIAAGSVLAYLGARQLLAPAAAAR